MTIAVDLGRKATKQTKSRERTKSPFYLTFIDINFKEHCSWILGRQLFIEWSDSSTWSTPGKHRGSYMSAHVLLNLLNELGKRDKMQGLPSILSLFCNEFNKFNNTRA